MILVIDNYDSFVETLARYGREAGGETQVMRNDVLTVDEALARQPQAVLLSPGPGRPKDAGICLDLIKAAPDVPILGVCLGHQALADAYGGSTIASPEPMHGQPSLIRHQDDPLFADVPNPFAAGRYHSLLGNLNGADELEPIAWHNDVVMACRHRVHPHYGVQFHPESLLTPDGHLIISNFLRNVAKMTS